MTDRGNEDWRQIDHVPDRPPRRPMVPEAPTGPEPPEPPAPPEIADPPDAGPSLPLPPIGAPMPPAAPTPQIPDWPPTPSADPPPASWPPPSPPSADPPPASWPPPSPPSADPPPPPWAPPTQPAPAGWPPPGGPPPGSPAPAGMPPGGPPTGGWQPPPGAGYPPPGAGYPPPPGYGPGTGTPQTEPLSIWSLVLGILSFFICGVIGGIAAIITGSKAKKAINTSGGAKSGRGMATAGQILGVLDIVASIVVAAVVVALIAGNHHVSYTKLSTGDCFNRDTAGLFADRVTKVSCASPHLAEVVGSFDADDGPWPGQAGISDIAGPRCDTAAQQYTTQRPPGLGVFFLYPRQKSWDSGTRLIVCELHNHDGSKRSGSVRTP